MKVKLICPAYRYDLPHMAEATVEVRLTPKQIVLEDQGHSKIVYVNGHRRGLTGIGAARFWRHNGMRVDGSMYESWRLAPGEFERLNDEAARIATS